jgi:hypothetical protein
MSHYRNIAGGQSRPYAFTNTLPEVSRGLFRNFRARSLAVSLPQGEWLSRKRREIFRIVTSWVQE